MGPNKIPITRTKIIMPRRRPEILSRQRLIDLLLELLDGKLTIVAAPAGYGKTSLLIDFASQVGMHICWFTLDPLDRDPQRFLAHLIASLRLQFPHFGKSSLAALEASTQDQFNLDGMISTLTNDIYEHITEHFTIFLDDYHLVSDSKPVESFINRFIQDVDENCHLVIASRVLLTLPDLPLMVARSQVGGLSFEELAFRPEEMQKLLLQDYKMTVSWETAQDLVQQTEGWITALLLSTQIIGRPVQERLRIARVSGIGLYEYLTQQIFMQQPADVQDFLLRTSLLEEFDASLCRTVIGQALALPATDWDSLMETALQNNLFILPVGEKSLSLRYHHLFRDFLQNRMLREQPDETRKIQLRLARVYAGREDWERAYEVHRQLGHPSEIATLIEQAATPMIARGRLLTLAGWLEALPGAIVAARPALVSIQGSLAIMRGDASQGLDLMNQAIDALQETGSPIDFARAVVRRSTAHRLLGEYALAIQDADQVLALPVKDQAMAPLMAEAMRAKGISLYQTGCLQEALAWSSQALQAYRALQSERDVAVVSLETGMILKATGDYEGAKASYLKALDFWQTTGNSVWQANLLNNLGVLQHLQGDYDAAISSLERAIQHAQISSSPRLEAFALASIGDLYRDLQATLEASEAYHKASLIAGQVKERYLSIYLDLAKSQVARLSQQEDESNELLEKALQQAELGKSQFEINLCRLERSKARVEAGAFEDAVGDLEAAAGYFKGENHRIEAALAYLYLAIAATNSSPVHPAHELPRSSAYLAEVFALIPDEKNWQPLIASGLVLRPFLTKLQDPSPAGRQVSLLRLATDRFEQRLPEIMRLLRHKATSVAPAPAHLTIRALGHMQVRQNDRLVTSAEWRQTSARDLLFLLLAHPEGLTKEQVGLIFWPDSSPAELKLRFKNAMYRLRHAVGNQVIRFENELYRFNDHLDYSYDVESFLNDIALADKSERVEKKVAHYKSALRLYKGVYLPDIQENWILPDRQRLESAFFNTLLKITGLLLETEQVEQALKYSQHILDIFPSYEEAHLMAMQVYETMGNTAAAIRQYEVCRQILQQEYDTTPSDKIRLLYEKISH